MTGPARFTISEVAFYQVLACVTASSFCFFVRFSHDWSLQNFTLSKWHWPEVAVDVCIGPWSETANRMVPGKLRESTRSRWFSAFSRLAVVCTTHAAGALFLLVYCNLSVICWCL